MTSKKLSQIGELSLLEQIRIKFGRRSKNILVGIGDDAAVITPTDQYLLATTDMMVEGIHFDRRFTTPYQIGFKLISVNVSDVYAMGGKPSCFLLDISVKKNIEKKFIDLFFHGVKDAMDFYNTLLIGGDLSSSNNTMSFAATLIGYTRKYIQRSGAHVGDRIYVTGNLGDSACGLQLLKKIKKPVTFSKAAKSKTERAKSIIALNPLPFKGLSWDIVEPLLRRHLMPEARKPESFVKVATSMIDISDGLLIDLSRVCKESRVGARIYEENIPISSQLKETAPHLGFSPMKLALSGGEDYELLFTAPPGKKVKAIYIGDIIKSKMLIKERSGKEKPFAAEGYQHFSRKDT